MINFFFFFSIFVSLIETIGIGIIMPFISVASDFKEIHSFYFYLLNRFSFGRYHLVAYRLFENYMVTKNL
ncbi:hypothetical protein [Lebetimonas sp. JH292]|uniref:hypothetical protein n=1 Tax=Lebetimonas sp. JH292 TaxID=990068 RepID=UPI000462EF58|nr:hypothetical protein [Lebetimonas sp. JH292]